MAEARRASRSCVARTCSSDCAPRLSSLSTTGRCSSVSVARYTTPAAARADLADELVVPDCAALHTLDYRKVEAGGRAL